MKVIDSRQAGESLHARSIAQRYRTEIEDIEHHLQTTSVAVRVDEETPSVGRLMRKVTTRLFPMAYGVLLHTKYS